CNPMMQFYPDKATESLEFHKIKERLTLFCRTELGKSHVKNLRVHTHIDYVKKALLETDAYLKILQSDQYFPLDFTTPLQKELRLLQLENAVLMPEQLMSIKQLAINIKNTLQWFKNNKDLYPALDNLFKDIEYEQDITNLIDQLIDENAQIIDNASEELSHTRKLISQKRTELRKVFDAVLRKLAKQGYLADISESFLNNRRTVAIQAEHKRIVKGILHGESDSQKTVFIEPLETIELNNVLFSLEQAERREVNRLLKLTTALISPYQPTIEQWYHIVGLFDFIRGKALLAKELEAKMP